MGTTPLTERFHRGTQPPKEAREKYLNNRGREARRRRAAERGGTVRAEIDDGTIPLSEIFMQDHDYLSDKWKGIVFTNPQ